MKIRLAASVIMLGLISSVASAVTINNTQVEKLYTQSLTSGLSSQAHAVRVDKDLDASCNKRLYIEKEDRELYSTLLAYKISNSSFNLMYSIGQPNKYIAGHLNATCKLYSIY